MVWLGADRRDLAPPDGRRCDLAGGFPCPRHGARGPGVAAAQLAVVLDHGRFTPGPQARGRAAPSEGERIMTDRITAPAAWPAANGEGQSDTERLLERPLRPGPCRVEEVRPRHCQPRGGREVETS